MRGVAHGIAFCILIPLSILIALFLLLLVVLQMLHIVAPGTAEQLTGVIAEAMMAGLEEDKKKAAEDPDKNAFGNATVMQTFGGGKASTIYNPNGAQTVAALMALGYPKATAEQATAKAVKGLSPEATVEELVKKALSSV